MQIVIDISEDNYKLMQDGNYCGILSHEIYNAIKNATLLPKGHGRLIDADKLYNDYVREPEEFKGGRSLMNLFREADTIIEADKEGEK